MYKEGGKRGDFVTFAAFLVFRIVLRFLVRGGMDDMKHNVTIQVPVEKRGLWGKKIIVLEERTMVVDGKTYRRMKKEERNRPYSVEEMMLYD